MKLKVVGIFTLLALLVASAVCLAEVPTEGLVVYYPFDEIAERTVEKVQEDDDGEEVVVEVQQRIFADASPNGYDGVLNGTAGMTTEGVVGNALALDGEKDTLFILPVEIFENKDQVTISLWLKYYNYQDYQTFLHFTSEEKIIYYFSWLIMGRSYGSLRGVYSDVDQMAADIEVEEWTHLAVTITADEVTYFMNGVQLGSPYSIQKPLADLTPIRFAYVGYYAGRPFMECDIDEFRVYDRVLSLEEIQALLEQGQ